MSYTSENVLQARVTLAQVRELIVLLGYRHIDDGLKVPGRTDCCFWAEEKDYKSFVGVELDVYRKRSGRITITTRTRAGRSYWDLVHQNQTIKLFRDLLGGHFTTDAGRNRYLRPHSKPPSPLSSGCFLARWRFHNALIKARVYISQRGLEAPNAPRQPTGLDFLDEMNPRLLSNNLVLPYLLAIWEDYFKSTFIALLRYSRQREAVLKRARLAHSHLESIAAGHQSVEQALAETISFQRPSSISAHFRLLDQKLDIAGAFRRPYKRRKSSLFDSIESRVVQRNEFVHSGRMNTRFSDRQLEIVLKDFEVAVDRAYQCVAYHYGFVPQRDY